jgi:hypothetical protein
MKFRNGWKKYKPNYKTFILRIKISLLDILSIEIDHQRDFYALTILNFTVKNR